MFKHGMIVEKIRKIISIKQSKWLEKDIIFINFYYSKKNLAKNDFEKDFYKIVNNSFYGRKMENVRNLVRSEFNRKYEKERIKKQQSKLFFKGIIKSYENFDCYTFKQNDVLMDKRIFLRGRIIRIIKNIIV